MKISELEEVRIEQITDVIQKIASGNFSIRLPISQVGDSLDAISSGINMLAEEIEVYIKEKEDQSEALLNMLEDVNEAKEASDQAKNDLIESEEKYRTLFEKAPVGFVVIDLEGKLINCNNAAFEITELQKEDLIGKQFMDFNLISKEGMNDLITEFIEAMQGDSIRKKVLLINTKSGEKWIEAYNVPLKKGGEIYGLQLIIQDITERKIAEEKLMDTMKKLKRSNIEIAQFNKVAYHDLQEPLRSVSSYVQLLERRYKGKLDNDADVFLGYIIDGTKRMHRLINDLLAYSNVGTSQKSFEQTDTTKTIKNAISSLKPVIMEKDAVITYDPLPLVEADNSQLFQLSKNLLSNAIKFHGSEPPRVHIGVEQKENEWMFSVRDNGIGIDPKFADRIFTIFQKLHSQIEYPGTGIGLAICKKIIDNHGGRIWVESKPGKGSTFYFTIPRRRGDKI